MALVPAFAQSTSDTVATIRQRTSWSPSPERVHLRAVVTVRDEPRNLVFVQDATGGMFVRLPPPGPMLERGELVDVYGTAVMTERGPTMTNARVIVEGSGVLPAPQPMPALAGRLMAADARLVAAEGVVRAIRTTPNGVEATIQTSDGALMLVQPLGVPADQTPVDAIVRVDGVLSHVMAQDRSLQRRELVAVSPVQIVHAAPADPFGMAEMAVADLRRQPPGTELIRRVRVTGVVTFHRPGQSLYLRTATQPIRIEAAQATRVAPGDRVEAVGFPTIDGFTPFLADAMFRRLESGPAPPPAPATLPDLMAGSLDAELVRVDATYLDRESGRDEHRLVIQAGDVIFNALVPLDRASPLPAGLHRGQRVQLVGVCSVLIDGDGVPRSFRLQLRNAADLTLVASSPLVPLSSPVPWWAWLSVVVALAGVGAAGAVFRASRLKERTIHRQLARESALKARFDDLFERSSEVMVVHDRRGRVSTLNRAGEQATGYAREELRMLDPSWVFGTDYLDAISQMIREGGDGSPRAFRSELVPRKGTRIPVEVHARVLVGDGEVIGVTSIARDLSERDRLENELRQAQKMEAVGRLATGIAHDFNNLITVLLGYSDELIDRAPAGSEWLRAATEIRRAAERASGLTQQLLAFSRRHDEAVSHTVDLNVVIANMEDLIRRLLGPEIQLEFSLDPGLAHIRADSAQIGQVMMNLVVNARDAMPKGGQLTIETANIELGTEHLDVIPGPHVSLCVRDTGAGMAADVRDRLFEPFFTTKDSGHGTGLGLSMVQGIVRQSKGHVVVESEPGKGSAFYIYFPWVAEEAALPAVPQPVAPGVAAVKGEGVILLAEDDRSVRRLVVAELGRRGFTVLDAEDGRAALELFRQNKDRIDLLVTDVVMPRMNGADLAAEVQRIRPGQKVLFISGHPERAGSGVDPTGADNLLMKPFTADTLAARIKEVITGKQEADGWNV